MNIQLGRLGYTVNPKRVRRLIRLMGLEAIYPKPKTSAPSNEHLVYPFLLRHLSIVRPNQVWSADITYLPMKSGFLYLVAILDWFSRYVLSFRLSNTLDGLFCLQTLDQALSGGRTEIFNTEKGAQFTARAFTERLEKAEIAISMDCRGRAFDNIFIERLWRSVKYEDLNLNCYETVLQIEAGLTRNFSFYNEERSHQSLNYRVPAEVHFAHV